MYGETEEFFVSRAFDPSDPTYAAGREKQVVFHVVGANGTQAKPHIVNPEIKDKPAVDAVIITPKVTTGTWQRPPPAWILDFARDFHSDGWRVSLLGWSRGAYWTSVYVKTEPQIFTAAVLLGGYPMGSPESFATQANQLMTTGVPVLVVHGLKDEFCQKELYEPWLRQLDKTAANLEAVNVEMMTVDNEPNMFWPVYREVNCNHTDVLAPCSIPGKSKSQEEKTTCENVWDYLCTAFAIKETQEALQKNKEGKYKLHLVVQAMAVG